ncbi:MAG: hypothetical protein IPJ07_13100 [Acidobacteria bacterium]|nr:hypothetical protein [Acidobacteriota bacterium]
MDKAYRWEYSGRGRTYDYEGFNRLPNLEPIDGLPSFFAKPVTADSVMDYQKRFAPDVNGGPTASLRLYCGTRRGRGPHRFGQRYQTESNQHPKTTRPDAASAFATNVR